MSDGMAFINRLRDDDLRVATTIDTAWHRVEAALPDGWVLLKVQWRRSGYWKALALKTDGKRQHVLAPARTGTGVTPADALHALADHLEAM